MNRIDEALKRAGVPNALTAARGPVAGDTFVSPWNVGSEERQDGADADETKGSDSGPRSVVAPAPRSALLDGFKIDWRERLAIAVVPDPLLLDQFRRLAGTLLHNPNDLKTVMITSAVAGDGKTLTALNLALVLSQSYHRRVLLIEGDLRRPAIAAAAGLSTPQGGLAEVLRTHHDRKVTLVRLTEHLTLMPAGRPDHDPLSGLTSQRFRQIVEEARERYDWVILDTPPVSAAPDASLMLPLVDAVLLVVRARSTPHALVRRAIDVLGAERILGVVLNAVDAGSLSAHHHYYGDYAVSPAENSR